MKLDAQQRTTNCGYFFCLPISPDRYPDELASKHPNADTVGRVPVTDFKRKVRLSMHRLQTIPEKSAPSIRSKLSNTPRGCSLTYSLIINN
jgi:hypothetical protein